MCELNLRPLCGNKIDINHQMFEKHKINNFVFDVTRPWDKEYDKSRKIKMNNIMYNCGIYYAYIPDYIKKYYEISDDELVLDIFCDNFTLYLDNIQLKIKCDVIDINPVELLIEYKLKGGAIDFSDEDLERLIELKLFRLGKYLKKIEDPVYSERAIKILNEDKWKNDLMHYNRECEQIDPYKDGEEVDNYYLIDDYDYD